MASKNTPEKTYENKIKAMLKARGAWFIKYWGGGVYTRAGVPDILACYKGRFIAIEVKAEKGKPSDQQLAEIARIKAAGGVAIISRPSGFDALRALLNAIDEEIEPDSEK